MGESLPELMKQVLFEVFESLKGLVEEGGAAPSKDEEEVLVNQAFLLKVTAFR